MTTKQIKRKRITIKKLRREEDRLDLALCRIRKRINNEMGSCEHPLKYQRNEDYGFAICTLCGSNV